MKIKTDFVTNSSSSSFIVFFPRKIRSQTDVSQFIHRSDFVNVITKDAMNQRAMKVYPSNETAISKLSHELNGAYYDDLDAWASDKKFCKRHGITKEEFDSNPQWRGQMWEEHRILREERSIEKTLELLKTYEGRYAYIFNYGDEDGGIFAKLEHENDWGGLPYIRISHH